MTKAKRAWCKGNAYVRSGQHAKAIYWLARTQAILDGERHPLHRRDETNAGFMVGALVLVGVLAAAWAAAG